MNINNNPIILDSSPFSCIRISLNSLLFSYIQLISCLSLTNALKQRNIQPYYRGIGENQVKLEKNEEEIVGDGD